MKPDIRTDDERFWQLWNAQHTETSRADESPGDAFERHKRDLADSMREFEAFEAELADDDRYDRHNRRTLP